MKKTIVLGVVRTLFCFALGASSVLAQTGTTSEPLSIVVGFTPGGVTDVLARFIGQKLSEKTGQSVVIENRPGATSTIAASVVARSKPNGNTLLFAGPAQSLTPFLYKLNHEPLKDFSPVGMVASVPLVLAVHPSVPAANVGEFIAYAKDKPGELYFSSGGTSSLPRMAGELFKIKTGVEMSHVAYKGSAASLVDLIAGRVQLSFDQIPTVLQLIKHGQLRALAVTTSSRSAALPDVPTMAEAGIAGFEVSSWNALLAPKGTPKETLERLNQDIRSILATSETKIEFGELGATPMSSTPEELGKFLEEDSRLWGRVIKEAGITAN